MTSAQVDRLLFATRTTAAALLAAYIAMFVPLPQASTSLLTVLIVSQPLAGMVLSKSLYRFVGSCVGAVVAVTLTNVFSDTPEAFAMAASAWVALCVYVSIYLRDAPSSYGALLSGYTVAIIAFPAVQTPDTVFLSALDRVSEIGLGIACATLFSQTFFPKSAEKALRSAADSAITSAAKWAAATLHGGERDREQVARQRRALVAGVNRLDGLRVHASFDSANVRLTNGQIQRLHAHLVSFLALLVSVHDRLEDLNADRPDRAAALAPLFRTAGDAMGETAGDDQREAARAALLSALPPIEAMRRDRETVMEHAVLLRVADLVAMRQDLDRLGQWLPEEAHRAPAGSLTLERHHDHKLAAVSAAAAFAALLAVFAVWIATGWSSGASAAIQVAVMVSLFAQQDDPASSAVSFLTMTAISAVVAALYLFAILPHVESFEGLALALAPMLFAIAYVMAIPAYTLRALALGLGAISQIGLAPSFAPDFTAFANTVVANLFGLGFAAILLRVIRPIGVAWPIARLRDAIHGELANTIAGRRTPTRLAFESRMLDLVNGLMSRLDLGDPSQVAVERGALASIRIGLNALVLRNAVRALPPEISEPLSRALADLARHFRRLAKGKPSTPPLARLDAALDAALQVDGAAQQDPAMKDIAIAIAALRSSLARRPDMYGAVRD